MPTIAIFNGIIIQMFFEDHNLPHVHAIYGGAKERWYESAMARSFGARFPVTRRIW